MRSSMNPGATLDLNGDLPRVAECRNAESLSEATQIPRTVVDALLARAAFSPRAAALHAPGRRAATFADVAFNIAHVRARFGGWGIVPGDIVAFALAGRPEMAMACLTLPAASTCAPLSATATYAWYGPLLDRLRPKAVVIEAGNEHPLARAARERGIAEVALMPEPDGAAGAFTLRLRRDT